MTKRDSTCVNSVNSVSMYESMYENMTEELYNKIRELCIQDPGETHRGIDFPCFLQLMHPF